ncbi:MAG: serine/threonine protein kinase [Actinobacteria bacterium]|nr:serine/threonine protein kinase [Actinomycetota bacterium]
MEQPLILDRYRPLTDLGSGGHGSVVLAFDTKMARRVAIKRLPLPRDRRGLPTAPAGLAEARTAALLNHPNIVTVHEWDTDADEAFIVMEALDGASVADLLDETGEPFTPDEAAAIVAGVSAALTFAHDNGVLHLDLKPANVLLTRDGRVKVADFGVSALTDVSGRASATAGTVGYMPPEQIRGQQLDESTDVWALGALVYEVLANANPFDADSAEGSLFKIEVAEVPAPSEFEPSVGPAVDDIVLRALAPAPFERYATVAEFARALLPTLGDPEAGRRSLAGLVESYAAEEEPAAFAPLGLWDRLAPHATLARHAAATLACAWLAWSGSGALPLGPAARLVTTALVAVAGAFAPALGAALGYAAFALGAGFAFGWPVGAIVGVLLAAFWLALGRRGTADGYAPVFAPALGIVHAAPASPLLLGFVFEPLPAALASGVAALAAAAASALTGRGAPLLSVGWRFVAAPYTVTAAATSPLERLGQPGTGIAVLAWMAAGAACSLLSRRATRASAFAGIAAGAVALAFGYVGWRWLAGPDSISVESLALDLTLGSGLALVVAALGAPTRSEEE